MPLRSHGLENGKADVRPLELLSLSLVQLARLYFLNSPGRGVNFRPQLFIGRGFVGFIHSFLANPLRDGNRT